MGSEKIEQTLAMIKPDAIDKADKIERDILDNGFDILQKSRLRLSREDAKEFYAEHAGKPFFDALISYVASGELIAMILSKENAMADWRALLGPTNVSRALSEAPNSIRAKYGDPASETFNAAHGSDSQMSAQREIQFFFPELTLEQVLNRGTKEYLMQTVSPTLVKGLSELCKVKPADPVVWLADWLLLNNPNQKKDL